MSVGFTYPGVYIQELPSAVHTITGVATSIPAFVGYTPRGIDNRAQAIFSFADFQRLYGGLASNSELSYAVQQFYLNAPGAQAYVVRVPMHGATTASVTFDSLTFTALSSGAWANGQLLVDVDTQNLDLTADPLAFNLTITDLADQVAESFPAVTLNGSAQNYVASVVNDPDNGSQLVSVAVGAPVPTAAPAVTGLVGEAISLTGATSVASSLGGTGTATTTTGNFGLVLTASDPSGAIPELAPITVFPADTPIPQSYGGLAAQVQQAVNAALAVALPGASVQVTVAQVADGGQALRVSALLPQQPDAVISFAAPSGGAAPLGDAATPLGLAGPSLANVAHYALGTGQHYAPGIVDGQADASVPGTNGSGLPQSADLVGDQATCTGIYALQKVDLFNLLSIPDATRALPSDPSALDPAVSPPGIYASAIALCDQRRAFLLVDPPPNVTTVAGAIDWKSSVLGITDPNGAAFWPRLRLPDQLSAFNLRTFAPSGVVAGVYAASDGGRGVWTAPAGIQATLSGVQSMTYQLTDPENGLLNPLGLNCFRTFPVYGSVLWGARTLAGADALASQWKYVPVRRMALFLEESLYRGLKWAVFQPNDEALWAAIRLNVGSFMQTYFQKQAFQGQTPDQAYFVKCDSETTTQTDINNGIVNVLVGFAPLQPAEFVVIQIEQLTGQAQS
jgi:uncharacterized protein